MKREEKHCPGHRNGYDYAAIRQLVGEVAKLKMPDIKAIGERVPCHLTGRSKAAQVNSLENWLSNIKLNPRSRMRSSPRSFRLSSKSAQTRNLPRSVVAPVQSSGFLSSASSSAGRPSEQRKNRRVARGRSQPRLRPETQ